MKEFTIDEVKRLINWSHDINAGYHDHPSNTYLRRQVAVGDGYEVTLQLKAGVDRLVTIIIDGYGLVFNTNDYAFCEEVSDCFNKLHKKRKELAISDLKDKIKSMESL